MFGEHEETAVNP